MDTKTTWPEKVGADTNVTIVGTGQFFQNTKSNEFHFDSSINAWVAAAPVVTPGGSMGRQRSTLRRRASLTIPVQYFEQATSILSACFQDGSARDLVQQCNTVLIVQKQDVPMCCIVARAHESHIEIVRLATLPAYRKQGFGRYALALATLAVSQFARDLKYVIIYGFCHLERFYTSSGFPVLPTSCSIAKKLKLELPTTTNPKDALQIYGIKVEEPNSSLPSIQTGDSFQSPIRKPRTTGAKQTFVAVVSPCAKRGGSTLSNERQVKRHVKDESGRKEHESGNDGAEHAGTVSYTSE